MGNQAETMHAWSSATFKLALALSILAIAAAGEGHDHGGAKAFEWAGIFDTPADSYHWAAQAVGTGDDRKYVDPSMTMVAYGFSTAATKADMESKESDADTKLEGTCTDVLPGGTIKADGKCYNLKFQASTLNSRVRAPTSCLAAQSRLTASATTSSSRRRHWTPRSRSTPRPTKPWPSSRSIFLPSSNVRSTTSRTLPARTSSLSSRSRTHPRNRKKGRQSPGAPRSGRQSSSTS